MRKVASLSPDWTFSVTEELPIEEEVKRGRSFTPQSSGAQLSAAWGTKGGPQRTVGENPEHRAAPDADSCSAEFSPRKIADLFV